MSCAQHSVQYDRFCLADRTLLCPVCSTREHKGHSTESLVEAEKRLQGELRTVIEDHESLVKDASKVGALVDAEHAKIETSVLASVASIKKHFNELRDLINLEEQAALRKVEKIAATSHLALKGISQRAQDFIAEVSTQASELKPKLEGAHLSTILSSLKVASSSEPPFFIPQPSPIMVINEKPLLQAKQLLSTTLFVNTKAGFDSPSCDVSYLTRCLKVVSLEEPLIDAVLKRLAEMVHSDAGKKDMLHHGGISLVLDMIKKHMGNFSIVQSALFILESLCFASSDGIANSSLEAYHQGVVPLLLVVLDTFLPLRNEKVVSHALAVLRIQLSDVEDAARDFSQLGGLKLVLDALQLYENNEELAKNALMILAGTTSETKAACEELYRLGATGLMARTMRRHNRNREIVTSAFFVLSYICEDVEDACSDVVFYPITDAFESAKENFPSRDVENDVVHHAAEALYETLAQNQELVEQMEKMGATQAFFDHW